MDSAKRLTVGVPVYNGENYLATALDAILKQTYSDFTLIISDNASTDGTAEIVADYASRDERVISLRHDENLGAAPNYNAAFHNASPTEYFVWIAHDDLPYPRLFEEAITALDAQPDAVVAFARTEIIDPSGEVIGTRSHRPKLASPDAAVRYADVIDQRNQMHPVFGVMRRSALEKTGLHRGYTGSDRTLVAELAMLGPIIELPEVLFAVREHRDRSVRSEELKGKANRDAWFDTSRTGKIVFPRWRRAADFWRATKLSDGTSGKTEARKEFVRWLIPDGHWKRLTYDVSAAGASIIGKVTGSESKRTRSADERRPIRDDAV